jgi:hypothetical protein
MDSKPERSIYQKMQLHQVLNSLMADILVLGMDMKG